VGAQVSCRSLKQVLALPLEKSVTKSPLHLSPIYCFIYSHHKGKDFKIAFNIQRVNKRSKVFIMKRTPRSLIPVLYILYTISTYSTSKAHKPLPGIPNPQTPSKIFPILIAPYHYQQYFPRKCHHPQTCFHSHPPVHFASVPNAASHYSIAWDSDSYLSRAPPAEAPT
jgi:hypothetical protein